MKILCVIDSLGSGGAQRQLVNLAIAFKNRGHAVEFLVYHRQPFFYRVVEDSQIPIHEVIERSYFKRLVRMRTVIRSGDFDTVLSFLEAASFISTVSGFPYRRWRLVVGERSSNPAILTSFKLRFYRFFHLFVDVVVANSRENLRLVKKANPFISKKKLKVIYNLIDLDAWRLYPEKYKYSSGGKFNLVVVASHQYLKNLIGLVEAVNLLDRDEQARLIVNWYGGLRSDNSKSEAEKKINQYQIVSVFSFDDPTRDIVEEVSRADALGLFSFYEGFPNVVCEAMANAKPVIASDVSDISIFIGEKFVFDPKDIYQMRDAIRLLLSMSPSELVEIGKVNESVAVSSFRSEEIVKSYLSLM